MDTVTYKGSDKANQSNGNNMANQSNGHAVNFTVDFASFDFEMDSPFNYQYVQVIYGVLYGLVFLGCVCGRFYFYHY